MWVPLAEERNDEGEVSLGITLVKKYPLQDSIMFISNDFLLRLEEHSTLYS